MSEPTRPNVLLIQVDDMRHDTLGALGHLPIHTPNLDRLMGRGTTFTRAHIMGASCGAVCMPSRAMLHTGRTLYHLHETGQHIPEAHVMLGEHLGRAGYHTWACGKWHSEKQAFARSFADGDEIFFGGMTDHWNMPAYRHDPSGRYDATLPMCEDPLHGKQITERPADHIHAGRHSSEVLADAAVGFLQSPKAQAGPWFMSVATLAPHDPRIMPERFARMYDPATIELPPNYAPVHPFDNGALGGRDENLAKFPRTESEIRQHIADYYAIITHLDHELGRIFDALDASGQAERTILVMTADHGLSVGQHGLLGKQNLYDHSIRIPMILAGPGVPRNERRDGLCYHIDLYPTLCELLGLDVPATVEGRSLVPCLNDASAPMREVVHLAYCHLMRGASDGKHKLIEYVLNGRRRTQLFDLEQDPWEMTDRSGDADHASVLERLRGEMMHWRDALDDHAPHQGREFWEGFEAAEPSAARA